MVDRAGFEPAYGKPGQIYSLLPLTTRPPVRGSVPEEGGSHGESGEACQRGLVRAGPCSQGGAMRRKARQATKAENRPRFWGRHAVSAALANPERELVRLWLTREAAASFDIPAAVPVTYADGADLGRLVPREAPHQGVVAEVERLDDLLLADLLDRAEDRRPLVVLDQVTDPHNVGAILRSAAA